MKFLIYINEKKCLTRFIQFDDFDGDHEKRFAKILKCKKVQFTPQAGGRMIIHSAEELDFEATRWLLGRHCQESLFFTPEYIKKINIYGQMNSMFQLVSGDRQRYIEHIHHNAHRKIPILPCDGLTFLDKKTPGEIKEDKMLKKRAKGIWNKRTEEKKKRLLKSKCPMTVIHFLREFKKFKKEFRPYFEKIENEFYKKLFLEI